MNVPKKFKQIYYDYLLHRKGRGQQFNDASYLYQAFPELSGVDAEEIMQYLRKEKSLNGKETTWWCCNGELRRDQKCTVCSEKYED